MSYAPITRAGVEQAEPLTFPEIRRITIACAVQHRGRALTITFEGYSADEACDLLDKRFGQASAAPNGGNTPAGDAPMCPTHHKPMREGKGGWYCPSKLQDGSWCDERA